MLLNRFLNRLLVGQDRISFFKFPNLIFQIFYDKIQILCRLSIRFEVIFQRSVKVEFLSDIFRSDRYSEQRLLLRYVGVIHHSFLLIDNFTIFVKICHFYFRKFCNINFTLG